MFSWISGGSYVSINFLNFSIDFMIPISIICNFVYKLQSDPFKNLIFLKNFNLENIYTFYRYKF